VGCCGEYAADDLGRANYGWGSGRCGGGDLVLPLAICGTRILAERKENRVAQRVLLCPSAEFDARDEGGRDPGWLFVGFRNGVETGKRERLVLSACCSISFSFFPSNPLPTCPMN